MQDVKFLTAGAYKLIRKEGLSVPLLCFFLYQVLEGEIPLLEIPNRYRVFISCFLFSLIEHDFRGINHEKA